MPNNNYFAQLSPKQKAELFLIYTDNGIYNLDEIMNHYNSEMERAYSSTEKDIVARMHDTNAPYLTDEEGNKMTHMMASGDGYVFPTIQRNDNGDLENYGDTDDWGARRAIERNDTLQFRLPSLAEYFSENYKTHLDNPIMHSYDDGGDFRKFFSNLFKKNTNDAVPEQQYMDYWDAGDYLSDSYFTKKLGKYDIESIGNYGDTHFDVVSARYRGLNNAMKRKGFTDDEIQRLMPFLVTQNVLEGGYRISREDNNFGGIMMPGTQTKRKFETEDDFYNYYLNNLDEKWGDDVLGKGRGWRNATSLNADVKVVLNFYFVEKMFVNLKLVSLLKFLPRV